ncbi:CoA-transferase [Escherichia coli]|uniref:CoA-transferase n=1 Tax=Escherichia coli TaxID=562 RepID=A0A376KRD5_ECOLX|nr:CoA-transferase [Escherichia coli]
MVMIPAHLVPMWMDSPLYYSFINHGKESVVLDLKNDHDKSIFINMAQTS